MADADGAAQPRATRLVPIEEVRAMSGLDFLRRIASGELPGAPISGVLAFEPTTVEHGRVVFAGTPELRFYNPIGVVHGGWAATLHASGTATDHTRMRALQTPVNGTRALTRREAVPIVKAGFSRRSAPALL